MQLNNFGLQIQKISMDLSFINNNYSIQLQNIGIQISNFSQQIFNIGMLIKNTNSIQQTFQMDNMMNNNMNMINFNNDNIDMNINNNMNNFIKEPNEEKIYVFFDNPRIEGRKAINISKNKTIKELLDLYREKIGEDLDFLKKNAFFCNGEKIIFNDNRTIFDFGITRSGFVIVVLPIKDVLNI